MLTVVITVDEGRFFGTFGIVRDLGFDAFPIFFGDEIAEFGCGDGGR